MAETIKVIPNRDILDILPKSNPVCEHQWERLMVSHHFVCQKCGYILSDYQIFRGLEADD